MNESAWERSQRSYRKKIVLSILIILPLCAIGIVFFLNNRDLLGDADQAVPPVAGKKAADDDTAAATPGVPETAIASERDTVAHVASTKPAAAAVTAKNTVSAPLPAAGPAGNPAQERPVPSLSRTPPSAAVQCCSEKLAPIPCILENRKDVVINLSLELFFTNMEDRSAILLRREDIKIMVLRTVRDQELPSMKIGRLETLLQKSICSIFDRPVVYKVKVKNIQIEKAAGK